MDTKGIFVAAIVALATVAAGAQTPPRPRPFPGTPGPGAPSTSQPQQAPSAQAGALDPALGVPLFPGAVHLATYDASPGQPFHLYGSGAPFIEVVEFYRVALKNKGRTLFGGPMQQFEVGRYRKETMTLQPGVTVKDFTWNGREGYVHVTGRQTVKYPTVIQVVPPGM
ncbi:MAG: hypothetical protein M3R55_15515 [Acidobacteriota bacterium]|nr:hypothetical protein [Acidobacteriota bacterium]